MQVKRLLFFLFRISLMSAILFSSSCMMKKYVYINENQGLTDTLKYPLHYEVYRLKVGDALYINIKSSNPQLDKILMQHYSKGGEGSIGLSENNIYLSGNYIDAFGFIEVPLLGKFNLLNKTLQYAEDTIQNAANVKFNKTTVTVRLVNFRLIFMGEVGSPGTITFNQDRISILEALANVGGITASGNMKKVLIIRADTTGSKTFYVDVSERKLLSNKEFFLHPGDIVYVEPRKIKPFRQMVNDYGTLLGAVSTIISTVALLYSLSAK